MQHEEDVIKAYNLGKLHASAVRVNNNQYRVQHCREAYDLGYAHGSMMQLFDHSYK